MGNPVQARKHHRRKQGEESCQQSTDVGIYKKRKHLGRAVLKNTPTTPKFCKIQYQGPESTAHFARLLEYPEHSKLIRLHSSADEASLPRRWDRKTLVFLTAILCPC